MSDFSRADILNRIAEFVGTDPLEGMHNWLKDPTNVDLQPPKWWGDMVDPEEINKIKTSEATDQLQ